VDKIITKKCKKCGGTEFGKHGECKICVAVSMKKYHLAHKEEIRAYNKKWRTENKERKRKYDKEWRTKNKKRKGECNKRWRDKNKERLAAWFRENDLKKKYGLTIEDYKEMIASQNGVCAICGHPPNSKGFSVDHKHETGKVRGLLCSKCNIVIGLLGDSPELLKAALEYLQRGSKNL